MMAPDVRTWAEIDLSAIRHNVTAVRRRVGERPEIAAVVKANAYGHGAAQVAQAIDDMVDLFGVANVAEAAALGNTERDVLLLSPSLPAEVPEVIRRNCIATVSSAGEAARFTGGRVCLKIDTGMGRIGCPADRAISEVRRILRRKNVFLHSIATHLPSADSEPGFTRAQLRAFGEMVAALRPLVPHAKFHALNSAGILTSPTDAGDMVRPGLMLYGSASPARHQRLLRPALTWKARILLVRNVRRGETVSYGRTFRAPRDLRVATLAAGYADGYPRQASNRGAHVLVGGRRCPVLGIVTMDQILVDVSRVPRAPAGGEAVLVGRQGREEIPVATLAAQAGTIAWQIFTGLGSRVRRVHH